MDSFNINLLFHHYRYKTSNVGKIFAVNCAIKIETNKYKDNKTK